jgi:catechol 2,3-dioxygenase-like lactoylglutathione lyase family enzyme
MTLQHVALEVRESAVADELAFWALLGFRRVAPPPALAGRSAWVEHGGTQIHLLYADDPVAPPEGHAAVVVEDFAAMSAALTAAGFDAHPRTPHWGAARAFTRSPAGHRVELMAAPPR